MGAYDDVQLVFEYYISSGGCANATVCRMTVVPIICSLTLQAIVAYEDQCAVLLGKDGNRLSDSISKRSIRYVTVWLATILGSAVLTFLIAYLTQDASQPIQNTKTHAMDSVGMTGPYKGLLSLIVYMTARFLGLKRIYGMTEYLILYGVLNDYFLVFGRCYSKSRMHVCPYYCWQTGLRAIISSAIQIAIAFQNSELLSTGGDLKIELG
jgi:hypothetical protein